MSRVSKLTRPVAFALFNRGVTWTIFERYYNFYFRISSRTWYKFRRQWTEEMLAQNARNQERRSGNTVAPTREDRSSNTFAPTKESTIDSKTEAKIRSTARRARLDISKVIGLVCRVVPAARNDWNWEEAYACSMAFRTAVPHATEEQVANFIIQNYKAQTVQPALRTRKATLMASSQRTAKLVLRIEGIDAVEIFYE